MVLYSLGRGHESSYGPKLLLFLYNFKRRHSTALRDSHGPPFLPASPLSAWQMIRLKRREVRLFCIIHSWKYRLIKFEIEATLCFALQRRMVSPCNYNQGKHKEKEAKWKHIKMLPVIELEWQDNGWCFSLLIVPFWGMNMLRKSRICNYNLSREAAVPMGSPCIIGQRCILGRETSHTSRKATATSSSCRTSPYMAAHCRTKRMTLLLLLRA